MIWSLSNVKPISLNRNQMIGLLIVFVAVVILLFVFLDLFGIGIENREKDLYSSGLDQKGRVYSKSSNLFIFSVYSFEYLVDGKEYHSKFEESSFIDSISVGSSIDVLVDKVDPNRSTINVGSIQYRSSYYAFKKITGSLFFVLCLFFIQRGINTIMKKNKKEKGK